MQAAKTQLEVLDLRHFCAPALRPLLQEEAARWEQRLFWDYSRSVELLLGYIDSRSLTGYVALRQGRITGYAFGVCEAAKAVLGDVYAFGEADGPTHPVCETLLTHLLETLQSTPGITRVEAQLLLFPAGALRQVYQAARFREFLRCFMVCDLTQTPMPSADAPSLPGDLRLERWHPEAYLPAAALIQAAYLGHTDSEINDQYRTFAGAQRFLHNIVHFPGCGIFDPANSWLLRAATGQIDGMVLCSRVRGDAAHITQLCIRDSLRGRGLGAALLRHCLQSLRAAGLHTVSLTVTDSNHTAMRLYQREGFAVRHRFEAWVWDQGRG